MSVTDPAARPRARPFWSDARFILGIVLVVGAVVGVWGVVAAARQTVPVLVANRALGPGEAVTERDVRTVEVALGAISGQYLAPADLRDDAVAGRPLGEGELIAASSVTSDAAARTTTVVIHAADEVPSSVTAGSTVEVWSAVAVERGRFDRPAVLVPAATVLSVTRTEGVVGSAAPSLELLIDRRDIAATLEAVAGGARLSVVPVEVMPQ